MRCRAGQGRTRAGPTASRLLHHRANSACGSHEPRARVQLPAATKAGAAQVHGVDAKPGCSPSSSSSPPVPSSRLARRAARPRAQSMFRLVHPAQSNVPSRPSSAVQAIWPLQRVMRQAPRRQRPRAEWPVGCCIAIASFANGAAVRISHGPTQQAKPTCCPSLLARAGLASLSRLRLRLAEAASGSSCLPINAVNITRNPRLPFPRDLTTLVRPARLRCCIHPSQSSSRKRKHADDRPVFTCPPRLHGDPIGQVRHVRETLHAACGTRPTAADRRAGQHDATQPHLQHSNDLRRRIFTLANPPRSEELVRLTPASRAHPACSGRAS